ncbi:MAG: hypothetical protein HY721_15095 [Planctomycetes bacterium]|nr:hypothetical protein [Planctomycetota bacterium]
MRWTLYLNVWEIAAGELTSTDAYASESPFPLEDGSRDGESLRFRASPGDVVTLELVKTTPAAELCGVRLTIRRMGD